MILAPKKVIIATHKSDGSSQKGDFLAQGSDFKGLKLSSSLGFSFPNTEHRTIKELEEG